MLIKEKKFYDALKDIFIGAKVEGESGYINLMRIKSRYYERGVFPKLQEDISEALKPFPEFREELFDKLYTFFNRYFSESGSIYFRYTPIHQNIYEKVYTDDRDVILFWKTCPLYYVKADRLFKNLEVETDGFKFFFDVSTLEHKKANEKREIIYEFKEKKDRKIVFNVSYTERRRKTKINEILKALKKEEIKISEDILEKAFRIFEKQSEVDYFINKNAKEFLREQFNIRLYQYVFSGESEWAEKRIRELQILKDIAFKIIDFISQFEDELVKIWNKPKFVLNSNYEITLNRISEKSIDLVRKILKHPNFDEQVKEWKELGIIKDSFDEGKILESNNLNKKYQYLPIDTKYFKDLEIEILGLFDDLDNSLDGWLIKGENYQALNTILPKFKEIVQTIYIDPPFNKEQDADYFYSVKYKDSSWITLLENRLQLAKDVLNPKGSIFLRCDYNGNMYVRMLMNEIFGKENFRNEISVRRFKKNVMEKEIKRLPEGLDNIYVYSNGESFCYIHPFKQKEAKRKGFWRHMGDSSGQGTSKVFFSLELKPPKGKHWKYSQEKIDQMSEKRELILVCKNCGHIHDYTEGLWNGCIECGDNNPIPKYWVEESEEEVLDSNWSDIYGYSTTWQFQTENSEILLKRVIESTSNEGDLVMDFFLGSGTTTAVAHKLKRKWIGIEMGEHFHTVVLPRMKRVLAYDKSGISKEKDVKEKYNQEKAGGFFKYYELEQYEDTLRKVKYEDSELFENPYEDPYNQYVFMKDLKLLEALEIDYENNKVKVDLQRLYKNIDLPETLSNLLGRRVRKITSDYVEFESGEKINIENLDYKLVKPLIWW
ncbi:MAG: putative methyltransferase [Candidatus Methanolliviera sp. GoM_oil]|nr:MAG: putative methyltransferase [Candidatus Methanolliviera sp. GoM_oil]